ncbi:MAG TPA: hypothetical protein DHW71_04260 [Gammaproteobacteria bacterium]|nr:hypothetical protein [Gammaproteobacteria bacterium]HBF06736.1 hypothetical protein [Gammaproteobacteria bacterium]HCK92174.1 hypothetical protein [Gammaproteobacteria bacterium]|tara:strand:- start:504 stop:1019 length:516 start_codon:yes stop_codon:yes gene_type:complete
MKSFFILNVVLLLAGCQLNTTSNNLQENRIVAQYEEFKFNVPPSPQAVASIMDGQLILRYGKRQGERYIAISQFNQDEYNLLGCTPEAFFTALEGTREQHGCNQDFLESFKWTFIKEKDYGIWAGDDYKIFYSVENNSLNTSFLFALTQDGRVIKLESDFLNKEELEQLFW